ncbi:MAG TPA: hypothetical protein VF978_07650 [Gemmatimonadales bacterium]
MGRSEWLEHTAEVRLRLRGATMAEMLAEAGRALAGPGSGRAARRLAE